MRISPNHPFWGIPIVGNLHIMANCIKMPSSSGRRKGPVVDLLSAISSGRNAPPTSNDKAPQKPRDLHIPSVVSSPLTKV